MEKSILMVTLLLHGCASFSDPNVWGPAAVAVVAYNTDIDQRVSDYAVREAPVFGSPDQAEAASDKFWSWSGTAYESTSFLTPYHVLTYGRNYILVESVGGVSGRLKTEIDRERPDGSNLNGMPSGHTMMTVIQTEVAARNLEAAGVGLPATVPLRTMAGLTAWARVEAGRHYPSDVLAAWSLGHLAANLFYDAGDDWGMFPAVEIDSIALIYVKGF